MIPLKTENLELELNKNIVHMRVSGPIAQESLKAGLDWIGSVQNTFKDSAPDNQDLQANDNFALQVDLPKDEFKDLAEISRQFQTVGRILRQSTAADKCAVMTDSLFIRNSAKVESAVIPGMEIKTFDLEEASMAERWLNNEPLLDSEDSAASISDAVISDNPWDNLKLKNLTL